MLDRIYLDYIRHRRFVSDVSHELRTPIAVIDGYANMLTRWAKDDETVFDESVQAISDEASHMKNLIENLLMLVRHDNNTINYNREEFDLSQIIMDVFKETLMVDGHKHEIDAIITKGILITGDELKVKQCIRIFADNAIKYTPIGKKVFFSLNVIGKFAVAVIRDEGVGIPKKDLPHVFERFYRSDLSRNRATGGSGLGLSLAKAIILEHKGKINLKSGEQLGTIVTLRLPIS